MKNITSIGIIGGTNGIGASFAAYFRDTFPEKEILVSGRTTYITNTKIVQDCDLVIFSVPIGVTQEVMTSCLEESRPDQIWMDFTSIKVATVDTMLQSKAQVCGAHPMFGPRLQLVGQKVILCPDRLEGDSLRAIRKLFDAFEVIETSASEHDQIMGVVQGLSHFSDFALGATLESLGWPKEKIIDFSSAPYALKFQVMGRMFHQNPELYAHISTDNPACRKAIGSFVQMVETLAPLNTDQWIDRFQGVQRYLGPDLCQQSYDQSQRILEALYDDSGVLDETVGDIDLAIFGGRDSHTDGASFLFPEREKARVGYFKSMFEVFEAVETGRVKSGIVPYENSNQGSVFQTLDELFDREGLHIISAQEKAVSQNLVGIRGTNFSDIKKIYSHPQAFSQSKMWVREHLPQAQFVIKSSTAQSAQDVVATGDKSIAAIASQSVAERLGLKVLSSCIEAQENKTRFVLIQKSPVRKEGTRLSLAFWFGADQAGNLAQVLTFFAEKNINLTKLDSRRADQRHGSYVFFIDAEMSFEAFEILQSDFEALVGGWKLLGSW